MNSISRVLKKQLYYTNIPLGAGASYTGIDVIASEQSYIIGIAFSDVAGTLYIEQSITSINWDNIDTIAVGAGVGVGFRIPVIAPYVRLRFVNGGLAQTTFRLAGYLTPI
jgi:hypothetical protein